MAATSNQETFKCLLAGRLMFDALRHATVNLSLATFTLPDIVSTVLGERRTLEVLPPAALARLAAGGGGGWPRLAAYALRRCDVIGELMARSVVLIHHVPSLTHH